MEFKGKVIDICCHKDNGWGVYVLYDEKVAYKVTGVINKVEINDVLYVEGDLINNKYGEQIKANIIKQELPSNVNHFADYLRKNISGIGPITAKLIVGTFKENTFDIIANEPQKLAELKGISKRKAEDISTQFIRKNSSREEQLFFLDLGISDNHSTKIKTVYEDRGMDFKDVIKNNPYQLIKDIEGIGFKKADEIARKLGIAKDSPFRIKSGIIYVMDEITKAKGNVYYPKNMLINEVAKFLKVKNEDVATNLECILIDKTKVDKYTNADILVEDKDIDNNVSMIYLSKYYCAEMYVAQKIIEILKYKNEAPNDNIILDRIQRIEKLNNTELDSSQRMAVLNAIKNNIIVITGGPGTGKTTTLNIFINYLLEYGVNKNDVLLAAPTGRAAKRMHEQTNIEAKTMHRLIRLSENEEEKNNNNNDDDNKIKINSKLKFDLEFDFGFGYDDVEDEDEEGLNYTLIENAHTIIIDEMSMVDLQLMNNFMNKVKVGTKLVFVGDADQLPSVGPGSVLRDLIASGIIPVAKLTKIHRQAKDSHIIQNAHKINNGELLDLKQKNDDFFFVERKSEDSMISTIKLLLTERIPARYNVDSFNVQILAPMKKGSLGVTNLNNIIQEFVNPASNTKQEIKLPLRNVVFREGDKVIHIKNDYNIKWTIPKETSKTKKEKNGNGIFNGEIGKIIKINKEEDVILIKYENRIATYNEKDLVEIELAYATTIHKSQGSEYPAIIIPLLTNGIDTLYNRNLLYTAVTRAKDCVAILGNNRVVYSMIGNTKSQIRYTYLANRLKDIEKETQKVGKLYA